jgi:hypothetical protein
MLDEDHELWNLKPGDIGKVVSVQTTSVVSVIRLNSPADLTVELREISGHAYLFSESQLKAVDESTLRRWVHLRMNGWNPNPEPKVEITEGNIEALVLMVKLIFFLLSFCFCCGRRG